MANVNQGFTPFTMNSVQTNLLPPPAGGGGKGIVSRWVIEMESAGWTGSVTVKSRKAGTNSAFKAVPYLGLFVNGAVGTGPNQATVLVGGSNLIEVDASGQEIALDQTVQTGGALTVTTELIQG